MTWRLLGTVWQNAWEKPRASGGAYPLEIAFAGTWECPGCGSLTKLGFIFLHIANKWLHDVVSVSGGVYLPALLFQASLLLKFAEWLFHLQSDPRSPFTKKEKEMTLREVPVLGNENLPWSHFFQTCVMWAASDPRSWGTIAFYLTLGKSCIGWEDGKCYSFTKAGFH